MLNDIVSWIGLFVFAITVLLIDLVIFHRKSHEISLREAVLSSVTWITLACIFGISLYFWRGSEFVVEFFGDYILEEMLYVENIFVFLAILIFLGVPNKYQHKVLFFAILGAVIMRGIQVSGAMDLINYSNWIILPFSLLLILLGLSMARKNGREYLSKSAIKRLQGRFFSVPKDYENSHLLVKRNGRFLVTPLLFASIAIVITEVLFAMAYPPTTFAESPNPLVLYSSNVFAVMVLHSIYFALSSIMQTLKHLRYDLAGILIFFGIKTSFVYYYRIPFILTLGVISIIIFATAIVFKSNPRKDE